MKQANEESFEERQGDIHDVLQQIDDARNDLVSAESCENQVDFDANLENAIGTLAEVLKSLKELRS